MERAATLPRAERTVPSWGDVATQIEAVYRAAVASERKVGAAITRPS
jgi:hypothetical protein